MTDAPSIVVLSSLYPSSVRPFAGLFIRERMRRVAQQLPLCVVSPVPWFPLQGLIRYWRPHYRPQPPQHEDQAGVTVYFPRFLALPLWGRWLDGVMMALCCWPLLKRLQRQGRCQLIDAHFAYPDGYAGRLLATWLRVPLSITVRGTEVPLSQKPLRRRLMVAALQRAQQLVAVSQSLRQLLIAFGIAPERITVVPNGVDDTLFYPLDKALARNTLGVADAVPVLISVGGLVPRKGLHRVIALLPALRQQFPTLQYWLVGGASAEGDYRDQLQAQVTALQLDDAVRFLGALPPDQLRQPLSAADVLVLASSNEGWANVLLEAMACGVPVVATAVGGNAEVVADDALGLVVAADDDAALLQGLLTALQRRWSRQPLLDYAAQHRWQPQIERLVAAFKGMVAA
jgi:teichuronic acid biosynthesis glycosyltransferase TuaC